MRRAKSHLQGWRDILFGGVLEVLEIQFAVLLVPWEAVVVAHQAPPVLEGGGDNQAVERVGVPLVGEGGYRQTVECVNDTVR